MALPLVTLYGRAGCHLCEEARTLLDALAPRLGFAVKEIDIDRDAVLLARFDLAVPVIAMGEMEVTRARLDRHDVERRLRAALSGRADGGDVISDRV